MFYPNLHQFEQRSVHTPTLDESVPQPLFDKRPSSISNRPYSAKDDSPPPRSNNVRPGRPTSASKQPPASMANLLRKRLPSPRKERDAQALARLRPRRIAMEKERLYDDAMHLKIENNDLRSENTKLKTKVSQMERELFKAQDKLEDAMADRSAAASAHLVAGLKQAIKDLRVAMKAKDLEVAAMRRSARSTKVEELEVELQTYVEECRRLQAALNDALRPDDIGDQDASKRELSQLRSDLKKAHTDQRVQQDLISSLQTQLNQLRTPKDNKSEILERQLSQQIQENTRLAEEHQEAMERLRREVEEADKKIMQVQTEMEQKMHRLEQELTRTRDNEEALERRNESLSESVERKNLEIGTLKQELSALNQELEQAKFSCESLTDDLSSVQSARHRLDSQLHELQSQVSHITVENQQLHTKLTSHEAQIASLQSLLKQKEMEIGESEDKHQTQLTAVIMGHKQEMTEVKRTSHRELEEKMKEEVRKLSEELEGKNQDWQNLQKTFLNTQQERNELQRRVSRLEKEALQAKSLLETHKKRTSQIISPFLLEHKAIFDEILEEKESTSVEICEEKLKICGEGVKELIILQIEDENGGISLEKLREELRLAEELLPNLPVTAKEEVFEEEQQVEEGEHSQEDEEIVGADPTPPEALVEPEEIEGKDPPAPEVQHPEQTPPRADNIQTVDRTEDLVEANQPVEDFQEPVEIQNTPPSEHYEEECYSETYGEEEADLPMPPDLQEEPKPLSSQSSRDKDQEVHMEQEEIPEFPQELPQEDRKDEETAIEQEPLPPPMSDFPQSLSEEEYDEPFADPPKTELVEAEPEVPVSPPPEEPMITGEVRPDNSSFESEDIRPQGPTPRDSEDLSARAPLSSSATRLADMCRHISFRMQITRLAKSDLVKLLFDEEEEVKVETLREHLMTPPLAFVDVSDVNELLKALPQEQGRLRADAVLQTLEPYLEDWSIFSQQNEDEFDMEIAEALYPHAEDFLRQCELLDSGQSGLIAYSDFLSIIHRLHINFTPTHLKYLQLLFYSEGQQLNIVPYETLIRAYAGQGDRDVPELTETQTKAVRGQLEQMAALSHGLRLDEVFGTDSQGLISPDAFVAGLEALGMPQPSDELLDLLFQSLQAEDSEEVCIALADLEDILSSLRNEKSKKSSMSGLDE